MLQQQAARQRGGDENEFGKLLFLWRGKIKRSKILLHLSGWSKDMLYRLEKGELAPAFDQLRPLYRALWLAEVSIPPDGPQLFVEHARLRSEHKITHQDQHTNEEWAELGYDLALMDREFGARMSLPSPTGITLNPLLLNTSHLVGREQWREEMESLLTGPEHSKIIAVGGPSGIGKTSEVNRLAAQLLTRNTHRPVLCDFHLSERGQGPEEALDVFLGTVLSALGYAKGASASLEQQVKVLVERAEESPLPIVMVIDHAEVILTENGKLSPCWERFLTRFLRYQHQATIVLVLKQWPGWYTGEFRYVAEKNIPALPSAQGIELLQRLGLVSVPQELLRAVCEKVAGIPLCLEWIAALAQRPLFREERDTEGYSSPLEKEDATPDMSWTLRRILEEPYVFGGLIAEELAPLLEERVLSDYHFSAPAYQLLQFVSLSTTPLAKLALDRVCPQWERIIQELRRASLLVSYTDRVQTLPSVAAAIVRTLSTEERIAQEEKLIEAYQIWLQQGTFYENEKGWVVAELATLLLAHRRLLSAAQLFIRHGWMAFHLGHAVRLARLARSVIEEGETWPESSQRDQAQESGRWLLHYFLSPYLGQKVDTQARATDFQRILDWIIAGSVVVEAPTELFVVRHLMFRAMDLEWFTDAQALVDACEQRLGSRIREDADLQASLLEKRGFLLTRWCEYAGEQQDQQLARKLREQAIAIYRQSMSLLTEAEARTTRLKSGILKKQLARAQTNLGFHLGRIGQFGEAIQVLKQSIPLKEQGYAEPGSLAASYGDLSQALAGLGDLQEALHYDELAMGEIQRLADAGDTIQQEAAWTYRVNRGRLYVKLGRLDEAERLLLEAIPKLPERWRMFRVFAQQALDEIKQQRTDDTNASQRADTHVKGENDGGSVMTQGSGPAGLKDYQRETQVPQYDAAWIEDYRMAVGFDALGMLSPTHFKPGSGEQEEWERLFAQRKKKLVVQQTLEELLARGKQRELLAALAEGREPVFFYPAIPLDEVLRHIRDLLTLQARIAAHETNQIVRQLYIGERGAIPYHLHSLRLIEAAAQRDSEMFWHHSTAIYPAPTIPEMSYALSRVKWFIQQGREHNHTKLISQQLELLLEERLSLPLSSIPDTQELHIGPSLDVSLYGIPSSPVAGQQEEAPETVRQIFTALFHDQDCTGWEAIVDYAARSTRIEPGLRKYIVANVPHAFSKIVELLVHEWGAHITPRVEGERSRLGLLGVGTGWSLAVEEGMACYLEWEMAKRTGRRFDESKLWIGSLATGLAAGVLTPPQKFLDLYQFFETFLTLFRLLWRGDEDEPAARERARGIARDRCLRTFRGVPPGSRPGICFCKDAVYEHGFLQVYSAVQQDRTVLDWLAMGIIAIEQIPDLQAIGMSPALHSPRALLERPDLEAYVLSLKSEKR